MGVAQVKMPQLGESVTEGTVDRWLKREGDYVRRDEPLVEVVTDKVNAEIPSPFEGRLLRISVQEGTTIPIGVEIAVIELAGGDGEPAADAPEPRAVEAAPGPAEPAAQAPRLSPAVRRLVQEHGVDPGRIAGSGAGGRVTRDDVLAHVAARQAPEPARPAPP